MEGRHSGHGGHGGQGGIPLLYKKEKRNKKKRIKKATWVRGGLPCPPCPATLLLLQKNEIININIDYGGIKRGRHMDTVDTVDKGVYRPYTKKKKKKKEKKKKRKRKLHGSVVFCLVQRVHRVQRRPKPVYTPCERSEHNRLSNSLCFFLKSLLTPTFYFRFAAKLGNIV